MPLLDIDAIQRALANSAAQGPPMGAANGLGSYGGGANPQGMPMPLPTPQPDMPIPPQGMPMPMDQGGGGFQLPPPQGAPMPLDQGGGQPPPDMAQLIAMLQALSQMQGPQQGMPGPAGPMM